MSDSQQQVDPIPATYCSVLSTQHHWCLPTAQHVPGISTSAENGKRSSLLSSYRTLKTNWCGEYLSDSTVEHVQAACSCSADTSVSKLQGVFYHLQNIPHRGRTSRAPQHLKLSYSQPIIHNVKHHSWYKSGIPPDKPAFPRRRQDTSDQMHSYHQ